MCELTVYTTKGQAREMMMEGAVRLTAHDGKVLIVGIFGESMEIDGKIAEVDIMAQTANIIVA